jgi:hypothetical protein
MNKPICPFCGTDKLTFRTRLSSAANRHYIGQFHCRKCGARSPIVHGKEWLRFYVPLSKEETLELKEKALQAFKPKAEEKGELL